MDLDLDLNFGLQLLEMKKGGERELKMMRESVCEADW